MIEPLRMSFVVECPVDHAFDVWTKATWWPASHTMTGDPADVVFEARSGGRIFERTHDGREVDFGEVTEVDPPRLIRYLWHMRTDRDNATQVEITFTDRGDDTTLVGIEHTGWQTVEWRDRNQAGWDGLLPHYKAACVG